jgi:hypothetical protein
MPNPVLIWWIALCMLAGFNLLLWLLSARALRRRSAQLPAALYAARRLQLMLSAVFVLGCAYRSILPVHDIARHCVVDSWLSNVLLGRTVATLAELSFAAQWTLLLREMVRARDSRLIHITARALLPAIVLAEFCSWHAVLTRSHLGHVIEESLWTLAAGFVVASLMALWPRCAAATRPRLAALGAAGGLYILFMLHVDVPMYWARWLADEATARPYLSLAQGLFDAARPCVPTWRWEDWRPEIAWMTLYFSVAVWLSIGMAHAPELRTEDQGSGTRPAPGGSGPR